MARRSRRGQRKSPEVAEEVALAHYDYLLDILPATVIRSGHAAIFGDLPPDQRRELNEAMASSPADGSGLRDAITRSGLLDHVARQFVTTDAVKVYFDTGAGSVSIDKQPPWVSELINHEQVPIDAGRMHHFKGVNSGVWFG